MIISNIYIYIHPYIHIIHIQNGQQGSYYVRVSQDGSQIFSTMFGRQALQLILRDFYRAMGQDGARVATGTSPTFAWVFWQERKQKRLPSGNLT